MDSRDKWAGSLHQSSRYGHLELEVSRVLLDHGANVNMNPANIQVYVHTEDTRKVYSL